MTNLLQKVEEFYQLTLNLKLNKISENDINHVIKLNDPIDFSKYKQKYYDESEQKFKAHEKNKFTALELSGLVNQMKESISNIKMGIKKNVTAKLRNEGLKYKKYLEAINIARSSQDINLEKDAVKDLMRALNNDAESDPQIINFVTYSNQFTDYIKALQILIKYSDQSKIVIDHLIKMTEQLILNEQSRRPVVDDTKYFRGKRSKLELVLIEIGNKLQQLTAKS